jgi:aerobic carbon-monoxide dehydrogenase medium subunit
MQAFSYQRPKTIDEATALFSKASDARYLAGGQTLIPTLKMRLTATSDLVDLGALKVLSGIQVDGEKLVIGAMTTHAEVANSGTVQRMLPSLATLAGGIGDRQVRNLGTLGGSLANNDPAACYPAAVLGLGAMLRTNQREISADKFFLGLFQTALQPGEIITSVVFPIPQRAAYVKFKNRASRFALVGVFVSAADKQVRVAVTGAGAGVFRIATFEQALGKEFSSRVLDGLTVSADGLNSDIHASAEYRAHLIPVIAKRAVDAALNS